MTAHSGGSEDLNRIKRNMENLKKAFRSRRVGGTMILPDYIEDKSPIDAPEEISIGDAECAPKTSNDYKAIQLDDPVYDAGVISYDNYKENIKKLREKFKDSFEMKHIERKILNNYLEFEMLKNSLAKKFMEHDTKEFEVLAIYTFHRGMQYIFPAPISTTYSKWGEAFYVINTDAVLVIIEFQDSIYELSLFTEISKNGDFECFASLYVVFGEENLEILDEMIKNAIKGSIFKNKVLRGRNEGTRGTYVLEIIGGSEIGKRKLDDIYIDPYIRDEIERLVWSALNNKEQLRILLSGEPGTAKTDIIRCIINMCFEKITIVTATGREERISEVFSVAKLLAPSLITIDDVDLMIGDRNDHSDKPILATFLQELDGITKTDNVFILATTNDKRFIDRAAKRPGRFDIVLDVGQLTKDNYMKLIKDRATKKEVIDVLDKIIKENGLKSQLTGAFVVNLIKQLESKIEMGYSIDEVYVRKTIKILYDGFYSSPEEKSTGF